ncbi:MAG: arginine--tRNA ligase [Limnochordaceae bacterium]|nr:arginine--tRNA ligase [Limnochordaceae bacterium]
MTLRSLIARELHQAVQRLLTQSGLQWPDGLELLVEQPARVEHGDYTSNVALQLARHLRKPPIQIATQLAGELRGLPMASKVEAAPPGFVNIWLDWRWWASHGMTRWDPPKERAAEKVVVEHTSINPNKAAHVGHLRNACIGDTLARLLRRVGYRVEVHNYIDDLGNQVADTVVGLLHVPVKGQYTRFGDFCWDVYARVSQAYERDEGLKARRAEVLHALEAGDNNTAWLGRLVAEHIVQEHVAEMGAFGITYNLLVWESDIVREGFWAAAFEKLKQSPLFVKETQGRLAGCWVLKQPQQEQEGPAEAAAGREEEADDEHLADKVLVRSNGVLTYTAKDIAYHLWKFGLLGKEFRYRRFAQGLWTTAPDGTGRPFARARRVLNVIDRRQEYPQAMVRLALQALGFQEAAGALHHVSYGVVSLSPATAGRLGMDTSEGRSSYPMSGRQGIGIKIRDLLDLMEASIDRERSRRAGLSSRAIAAGAIRYFLLRYNLGTEIVFDMDSALDVHGNTGPYLMYAHARAAGILRKAGLESQAMPPAPRQMPEVSEVERALLRHLADWPDTLEAAAEGFNPTLVTGYAYELAQRFTDFYENLPVLKAPEGERPFRIWLVALSRAVLADALGVLGLPAPERM